MRFRVKMHRHTKIFHIILCILLQIGRANKLGKWFTLSYLGQLQIMYFWIEFGIPRSLWHFSPWRCIEYFAASIIKITSYLQHSRMHAFFNCWFGTDTQSMAQKDVIFVHHPEEVVLEQQSIFGRIRRNMRRRRKITRRWSLFTTHGIRSAWLNYTMERSSSILKTGRVGEVRILLQRWGWGAVRHGVVVWRIRRMA